MVAEKGPTELTVNGASVGHLTADAKVKSHDGLHYDADLLEIVPKTVVLSVSKEVVKIVKFATSELTTPAITIAFEENSGDATGYAIVCCGCADGTEVYGNS